MFLLFGGLSLTWTLQLLYKSTRVLKVPAQFPLLPHQTRVFTAHLSGSTVRPLTGQRVLNT